MSEGKLYALLLDAEWSVQDVADGYGVSVRRVRKLVKAEK